MKSPILFFLLIIVAGCGTNNDTGEVSYPFQEQTWRVESGEFATWTGVKAKSMFKAFADSSADTTIISAVNGYGLQIVQLEADSTAFAIEFIDSTYNSFNGAPYSFVDSLFGAFRRTVYTEYFDEFAKISVHYPFQCGIQHEPVDTLNWVYAPSQAPEDTISFYRIVISGALETVDHIICQN